MRADHAFTARAVSTFTPDRLYRVYLARNQVAFIKIGGQAGVAVGVTSQLGLLGILLHKWWKKRSDQKIQERVAGDEPQDLGTLLARDRANFVLDAGQIVRSSIDPPARFAMHGPHYGVWKFEEMSGTKRMLQFEDLAAMREAIAALPRVLGAALAVNTRWDEGKGRYVRAEGGS